MNTDLSNDMVPCSPSAAVSDTLYFPRMVEKIRLHAAGRLRADLHENLGSGMDAWMCAFLRVDYAALREQVLKGDSDEVLLAWCEAQSRPLNEQDKTVWRNFILKLGWKDRLTPVLERRKQESGFAHRDDIQTMAQYIDADEGRPVLG
jgi:gluconokinase